MTMPAGWNHTRTQKVKEPGDDRKTVGKGLIVIGIIIGVLSFFGGSLNGGVFGFILTIIGTILVASGNSAQGRNTTFVGGGFVSTGGGGE
jgi:hypothetical protein